MNTLSYPIATELRSAVQNAKHESDPAAAFRVLTDKVLDLAMQTDDSIVILKTEDLNQKRMGMDYFTMEGIILLKRF